MRKALIIIMIMAVAAVLMAACERQEDKPVVAPGSAPSLNLDKEINFLRTALKEDPKNLQAWINLGNNLMDSQRYAEAVDAYGQALELDPKNVNVLVDRGTCYRRIGRPDLAAENFRKAIAIEPNHALAHRNLGVVLAFDQGDARGGRQEFEKYLQLYPAAPDAADIRRLIEELKAQG